MGLGYGWRVLKTLYFCIDTYIYTHNSYKKVERESLIKAHTPKQKRPFLPRVHDVLGLDPIFPKLP